MDENLDIVVEEVTSMSVVREQRRDVSRVLNEKKRAENRTLRSAQFNRDSLSSGVTGTTQLGAFRQL